MNAPSAKKEKKRKSDPASMTFLEHLDELRTRILSCLKVLVLVLVCCGWFWQPITKFFLSFVPNRVEYIMIDAKGVEKTINLSEYNAMKGKPGVHVSKHETSNLMAIRPVEVFLAAIKSVLVVTLIIASPWILYQIWLFVAPGLYVHEKRYVLPFVGASTFFFICGLAFAYFAGIPLCTKVLYSVNLKGAVLVQWTVENTLSYVLRMFLAFGIAFEMPVVVFVLAALGIVSPKTLARQRPYVVTGIFILGAILTPPDWFSQVMLAGPLWILFELSIIAARIFVKRREAAETVGADDPYA